jgi:hypothetical protein
MKTPSYLNLPSVKEIGKLIREESERRKQQLAEERLNRSQEHRRIYRRDWMRERRKQQA